MQHILYCLLDHRIAFLSTKHYVIMELDYIRIKLVTLALSIHTLAHDNHLGSGRRIEASPKFRSHSIDSTQEAYDKQRKDGKRG